MKITAGLGGQSGPIETVLVDDRTEVVECEGKTLKRADILNEALRIVTNDREYTYGVPADNFKMIAALWSAYSIINYTPEDVAIMMALFKIARISTGKYKADNYIDLAGYAACAGEIAAKMKDK